MKERLKALAGPQGSGVTLSTFHGLGARLLREQAAHSTRSANFLIFDAQDSERLIKQAMKEQGISLKEWSPKQIRHRISQAKNRRLLPTDMAAGAQNPTDALTAKVYGRYQQLLAEHDAYDFDDLLLAPLDLLQGSESIRTAYQRRWPYISVDEYQDTNPIQEQMLQALLGPDKHLCVVGDDYQAIYSWRGAEVDHILHFQKQFPNCATIYLTQNYRSTPQILAAANQIISTNKGQMHKELWTDNKAGQAVRVVALPSDLQEATWIRQQIEEYARKGGKRRDAVVLYRTNAQSRLLEEQFLRYGIPYTIVGGFRFYERREVKDALAFLQLWVNPNSTVSLRRLIEVLCKGIGPQTIAKLQQIATNGNFAILDVAASAAAMKPALRPLTAAFTSAKSQQFTTVAETLRYLLEHSGYITHIESQADGEERKENIDELLNVSATYTHVADFLAEVALLSDIDTLDEFQDRITCMTLHAAKGLEFSHVWIVGCEEGLLPHINSIDSQSKLEEERRLLYVGMTRAEQQLTLTYAATRSQHGEFSAQLPSRFLAELPEGIERIDFDIEQASYPWLATSTNNEEQSFGTEPAFVAADIGEFVHHNLFGRGVVIGSSGSLLTCVFEGHGVKTVDGVSVQTSHGITD
jgi:DNA helicase-2/ATP-dependent DNA helicase PcrA